ncbi:MAG TPA: diguanylate cyclase [Candidatus Paceibacterota bacterium]|nr:diguanylate cyclase [Candidatus Paceibacterota bacterium]
MTAGPERPQAPERGDEKLAERVRALEEELARAKAELAREQELRAAAEKRLGLDYLTGAANRGAFDAEFDRLLGMVRGDVPEHRAGAAPLAAVSLILIDLDYFKRINDTHGHPAGDEVLRTVVALLKDSFRDHEMDVVARVGGEELAVLMAGANEEIAARKVEKVRAAIAAATFAEYPKLAVTASFGIASTNHAPDAATLYRYADAALYEAKEGGRDRAVVYHP